MSILDALSPVIRRSIERLSRLRDRRDGDPTGVLNDSPDLGSRYGMIPPESVPFFSMGVDGCHYAMWIDDPRQHSEPEIVFVSPMDPFPSALRLVASDADTFLEAIGTSTWRSDTSARERDAITKRHRRITHATADGMGIVEEIDPSQHLPVDLDATLLEQEVRSRLARGEASSALVLVRNEITRCPLRRGFGNLVADVYHAVGRDEFARVALQSYEPTDEALARIREAKSRFAALMSRNRR